MKTKLFTLLLGLFLLASCSPKLTLSDGTKTKTFKVKKEIYVVDGKLHFTNKSGLQQIVPVEMLLPYLTPEQRFQILCPQATPDLKTTTIVAKNDKD